MQFARRLRRHAAAEARQVQAEADLDILLQQVVGVDQDLPDLVGGIGVFALFRVVVLQQELAIACSMTGRE